MTAQTDPYVRVYYRIIDDPKFAAVFDDDSRLACWLRLLLVADGTWPAPAPVPANVRRGPFQHLVDVGLIDLVTGGRYRIHGMDAERGERRVKAQKAAYSRHSGSSADAVQSQSTSSANANGRADVGHLHSAPTRSEPIHSTPRQRARDDGDVWTVAQLIEELTGRTPSPKVTEDLRADVRQMGAERVMAAIREVHEEAYEPLDAAGLVYGAHNRMFPLPGSRRETPAERKQRERDDYIARTKAEVAAAKAAQA